jgi:hypothetical protein
VVSGATLRAFGYLESWFQVPKFVVSGTGRQESIKESRGLEGVVEAVTLLNTDSNLNNTRQERKNSRQETTERGQ